MRNNSSNWSLRKTRWDSSLDSLTFRNRKRVANPPKSEIHFGPRWKPWTEYRFKFESTACQPQYLLHLRRNKRRGEVTTDISHRRLSERRLNRRIVGRPLNGILHKTTVALTPGRRPKRCKRASVVVGRSLTLPIIRTVIGLRPFLSRENQGAPVLRTLDALPPKL